MDYLMIGATPCDEPCAQVGQEDYGQQSRLECKALIAQLERAYPYAGPEGTAWLYTKANPHDFGTYYEVAVKYDEECKQACDWAYLLEESLPERWDEQAREWLLANGYRHLSS